MTNPVRVLSLAATLAAAAVTAALLITIDGDAVGMIEFQHRQGETAYAVGIGWVVLAPVAFVIDSSYVAVSTAPWVALCVAHVAILVAVSVEFAEMMSVGYWIAAGVCTVAAIASVVAAVAGDKQQRGQF